MYTQKRNLIESNIKNTPEVKVPCGNVGGSEKDQISNSGQNYEQKSVCLYETDMLKHNNNL